MQVMHELNQLGMVDEGFINDLERNAHRLQKHFEEQNKRASEEVIFQPKRNKKGKRLKDWQI